MNQQSVGIPFEKTWVAAMINTRHTHKAMHGVTVDGSQMFLLPDGSQMEYPRDWRFGAPAGEIVNCQCMVVHREKETINLVDTEYCCIFALLR